MRNVIADTDMRDGIAKGHRAYQTGRAQGRQEEIMLLRQGDG